MKILEIIDKQIEIIYSLNLEPKAIQLDEDYHKLFIEECKQYITTATDAPAMDFKVEKYRDLEITKVDFSNTQFIGSAGFVSPIQVTIKQYYKPTKLEL